MELDILGLDILGRTFSILVVAVYHNLLLTFLGLSLRIVFGLSTMHQFI